MQSEDMYFSSSTVQAPEHRSCFYLFRISQGRSFEREHRVGESKIKQYSRQNRKKKRNTEIRNFAKEETRSRSNKKQGFLALSLVRTTYPASLDVIPARKHSLSVKF